MVTLPSELWIMIFDMVIIEEMAGLDQYDHTTFPHGHVFLSPKKDRYRLNSSYHRLRIVCRSFNALLETQPYYDLSASSFPLPTSIRALSLGGRCDELVFQQLLVDTARCERLVFLKMFCDITTNPSRPNLSDLLSAGEGGAFPNIQRLALWVHTTRYGQRESAFWTRLHRGFPQLVTLSVEVSYGSLILEVGDDKVVPFERLEILYIGGTIIFSGCHFPRLRHASVEWLWSPSALKIFRQSPGLECLLFRSDDGAITVDVRSFSRLHVLSLHENQVQNVVPLDCDHPLEHLWIHFDNMSNNPTLIDEIVKRIPRIRRITMDLSSVTQDRRTQRIQEFQRMRIGPFRLVLRPIKLGDHLLVIE